METTPVPSRRIATALARWLDSSAGEPCDSDDRHIDWLRTLPFIALHLACVAVIWVGVSPVAVASAVVLYIVRMFAITAFYHRYFSHRAFRASRAVQFLFAAIGASSVQRGPLWWAAHHRNHHRHADDELDPHSPVRRGFLWSHVGWFLTPRGFRTDWNMIRDLARYPELRLLDRFDILMPVVLAFDTLRIRTLSEHRPAGAGNKRAAAGGVGFLHFHGGAVPCHLHDQLTRAPLRQPALRHPR